MDEEPLEEEIQFVLGPYQVLKCIGQGGMGEVFLAYDPVCGRKVALKRLLEKRRAEKNWAEQFKKEAYLTAQLTHPAIMPIYAIHFEEDCLFFTMPYIEGHSLKEILLQAEQKPVDSRFSVPALSRIFLTVCQGIQEAHSHGIVHGDLKPSNILIGKQNDPRISDWGLITAAGTPPWEPKGTLTGSSRYLAPELLEGAARSPQTDIYSLGVIFYEILTLHAPFHRSTFEEYRQNLKTEFLLDPAKASPYRGISSILAHIAKKCLAEPKFRYKSVAEIISDLEKELAVATGWIHMGNLDSQQSYSRQVTIEATLQIGAKGEGLGWVLNADGGACHVWLSPQKIELSSLHAATEFPEAALERGKEYRLFLMKKEDSVYLYLNDVLECFTTSYLPALGTRIEMFYRDQDFTLKDMSVYQWVPQKHFFDGPDALLAAGQHDLAVQAYRNLSSEYPEALFKAGIALLEGRQVEKALALFDELKGKPGAPLEYLGKSLVYASRHEDDKEMSALSEGLKRFHKHPLSVFLFERLIYRLHSPLDSTHKLFCQLALFILTYLQWDTLMPTTQKKIREGLAQLDPFFEEVDPAAWKIDLAFFLKDANTLEEMIDELRQRPPLLDKALSALVELGEGEKAQAKLDTLLETPLDVQTTACLKEIQETIRFAQDPHTIPFFLKELPVCLSEASFNRVLYVLNRADSSTAQEIIAELLTHELTPSQHDKLQKR